MLPKLNRLKKSLEFQNLYKHGTHIRGKFCKLIFLNRKDSNPYRLGIVIPAKLGDAVHRNIAKRRVREIFRKHSEVIPSGFDISLVFWDISFDFKSIETQILGQISKIKE